MGILLSDLDGIHNDPQNNIVNTLETKNAKSGKSTCWH